MNCSLETPDYLLIGSLAKLYLVDKQSAKIIDSLQVARNIYSICSISATVFVVAE
jgi:hypothetical protein